MNSLYKSLPDDIPSQPKMANNEPKIVVVMPAFNAAKTLEMTYRDIPRGSIDAIILVDDHSSDKTVEVAKSLNLLVIEHPENRGYGANQKTCYDKALSIDAGIVVMLHPDYQYDPRIINHLVEPIKKGEADVVLASRMLGDPRKGGMPLYKFISNKFLTAFQNILLGNSLSEYHTGYRAFSREALSSVNYHMNSDGFLFDNEILVQLTHKSFRFKEIPVITRYFPEASMVGFFTASIYGLGIIKTTFKYLLHKWGIIKSEQFE